MARALLGLLVVAALGVSGYYTYSYVNCEGACSHSEVVGTKRTCCTVDSPNTTGTGECTGECTKSACESESKCCKGDKESGCEGKEGGCEGKEGGCCKGKKDDTKKE